ncbi:hypothetical protein [Tistrella mobilis]|nr:hypothetical protein [Tistrella mobilis]
MKSMKFLSNYEISLIKGMLNITPRLTDQKILAYFSRPDRDLSQRLIGQIRKGLCFNAIFPAQEAMVRDFMLIRELENGPAATSFALRYSVPTSSQYSSPCLFLDWWPVGQGLFSSGAIVKNGRPFFNWVYDCGTSSSLDLLYDSIKDCNRQRECLRFSRFDLVILSHFDNDHISGFSHLVQESQIRMILLPYLTPLQRLILAIQQGVSSGDAEFGFYIDPVSYLRGLDGSDIGEIVFVLPSESDDEAPSPRIGPVPDGGVRDGEESEEVSIKFEVASPPDQAQDELFTKLVNANVHYLKRGGVISAASDWEFLPYNDASMLPKLNDQFKTNAMNLVRSILNKPNTCKHQLDKLKKLYDKNFGKSSRNRNIISLFIYSGPIGDYRFFCFNERMPCPPDVRTRFAQIYTGDGILNTKKRFQKFKNYYQPEGRLARAGFLQVMHHGAKSSWYSGLAADLSPVVSIFSSDPHNRKYRHPHPEVLRDFWDFHPVKVDKYAGFHVRGILMSEI